MIYCIDTHTFIWSVKKQADEHDRHRLKEGEAFRQWLKDNKHQAMVPTMVLAEGLIKEAEADHARIISEAHRAFMVVPFDERCALKYGELLRFERWELAKLEVQKENGLRREKMKIDHMILCCALVNGADGIFTEDPGFIKFAEPHIKILSTSRIGIQTSLFENENLSING